MTDVAGHYRHVCVKRRFNEREIARIGDCAGHGKRRDKRAFPADECKNFVYRLPGKRELFPMKHIRIFIEYPCVKYQDYTAIDDMVENAGGGTMG